MPTYPMNQGGLSPRVRGNQPATVPGASAVGSIPACAGEPSSPHAGGVARQVYPRVCGGTQSAVGRMTPPLGLSPRVRGNPLAMSTAVRFAGSIPACAGEPPASCITPPGISVYPRVCGGTPPAAAAARRPPGLSPRVRGNLRNVPKNIVSQRSIPACAGEPRKPLTTTRRTKVYPRVCGGTPAAPIAGRRYNGLSPRVRGNLGPLYGRAWASRSIPACAGEPPPAAAPRR